jgi:hypothetical protein
MDDIVDRFRAIGRPIIYDIDDLVFDPDKLHYLRHVNGWCSEDLDRVKSMLSGNLTMMQRCDLVTVSTFALKLAVERMLGKPAHVMPNTLAPANGDLPPIHVANTVSGARVRIGYLSGTATHEEDFFRLQARSSTSLRGAR